MTAPRRLRWLVLCAVVFAARSTSAQTYSVLHDFSAGAGHPQAPLIQAADGSLWGTSYDGGAYGAGSIFTLTPDGLGGFTYAERHAFTNGSRRNVSSGGPRAGLGRPDVRRHLIGKPRHDLSHRVRRHRLSHGPFTLRRSEDSSPGFGAHRRDPTAASMESSQLWRCLQLTGRSIAFDPSSGIFTVLHDFDQTHGASPIGSLGRRLGRPALRDDVRPAARPDARVSSSRSTRPGDNFTVLRDFSQSANGNSPRNGADSTGGRFPLRDDDQRRRTTRHGVQDRQRRATTTSMLHVMQPAEGKYLFGGLVLGADGLLYGTSSNTDFNTDGTVYRLDSNGGSFEVVHTFRPAEGQQPWAGLLRTADDSLFGTTSGGGRRRKRIRLPARSRERAASRQFISSSAPDAFNSIAGLVVGPGGHLYGTSPPRRPARIRRGVQDRSDGSELLDPLRIRRRRRKRSRSASQRRLRRQALRDDPQWRRSPRPEPSFGWIPDGNNFEVIHAFTFSGRKRGLRRVIQGSDGKLYGGTLSGGPVLGRRDLPAGHGRPELRGSSTNSPSARPPTAVHTGRFIQAADGEALRNVLPGRSAGLRNDLSYRTSTARTSKSSMSSRRSRRAMSDLAALVQPASGKLYGTGAQGGLLRRLRNRVRARPSGSDFQVLHRFSGLDGSYAYGPLLEAADGISTERRIRNGLPNRSVRDRRVQQRLGGELQAAAYLRLRHRVGAVRRPRPGRETGTSTGRRIREARSSAAWSTSSS